MLQAGFIRNVLTAHCQTKGKKIVKKYGEYFLILDMSHCIYYLQEMKILQPFTRYSKMYAFIRD